MDNSIPLSLLEHHLLQKLLQDRHVAESSMLALCVGIVGRVYGEEEANMILEKRTNWELKNGHLVRKESA